jgi:hypothetical protein
MLPASTLSKIPVSARQAAVTIRTQTGIDGPELDRLVKSLPHTRDGGIMPADISAAIAKAHDAARADAVTKGVDDVDAGWRVINHWLERRGDIYRGLSRHTAAADRRGLVDRIIKNELAEDPALVGFTVSVDQLIEALANMSPKIERWRASLPADFFSFEAADLIKSMGPPPKKGPDARYKDRFVAGFEPRVREHERAETRKALGKPSGHEADSIRKAIADAFWK